MNRLYMLTIDEAGNEGWELLRESDDFAALAAEVAALEASGEFPRIEACTPLGSAIVVEG